MEEPAHTLRCPVCGKNLEARCADHPQPFLAYDPMIGLYAYAPASVDKQVLHEARIDGFRVLHLYFPGTRSEHLVVLPTPDGKLHPVCQEQFEAHQKAQEEHAEFCADCCAEYCGGNEFIGDELCPGCDCYTICCDVYDECGEDDDFWADEEDIGEEDLDLLEE